MHESEDRTTAWWRVVFLSLCGCDRSPRTAATMACLCAAGQSHGLLVAFHQKHLILSRVGYLFVLIRSLRTLRLAAIAGDYVKASHVASCTLSHGIFGLDLMQVHTRYIVPNGSSGGEKRSYMTAFCLLC